MGIERSISHSLASDRLSSGLRMFVGRGRDYPTRPFADAIGISESALEKAMAGPASADGPYTFGLATMLRVQAALPPAFTNHVIDVAGLGGARRLDGTAKTAAVILAELAGETALFAQALADGRIDHIERAELRRTLPALIEDLQNLQAALAKGAA